MVTELVSRGVTERLACRAVGLARSSFRYRSRIGAARQQLSQQVRIRVVELAHKHRRFGYRRITALLQHEFKPLNPKRVFSIWRAEKLQVPLVRRKKRGAAPKPDQPATPTRAQRRGQVWSYDFVFDRTERGRVLKMLTVVDEYSRECHKIKVGYALNSLDVKAALAELFKQHGAPEYLRSDNGGEFITGELTKWLSEQGIKTIHIAPGHPWENGYCESFNGKLRDECLNQEVFWHEAQAQVVVEQWRVWYCTERPHSALGYRTPSEVVRASSLNGS